MHSVPIAILFALAGFVVLWVAARTAKLGSPRFVSCPILRDELASRRCPIISMTNTHDG